MSKITAKKFWEQNPDASLDEAVKVTGMNRDHLRKIRRKLGNEPLKHSKQTTQLPPEAQAEVDYKLKNVKDSEKTLKKKYVALQDKLEKAERERDAVIQTSEVRTFKIPCKKSNKTDATMVVLASDWHIEEYVDPATVSGLNEFTLDIARDRSTRFFEHIQGLIDIRQKSMNIDTLVLALLGDFITGSIHDELMEGNQLSPIEALIMAQNLIASGIQALLDHTNVKIIVPCHSGNHGRATPRQRIATEAGNSFEYYMYHQLANYFRHEERVTFLIGAGYHSYLDIQGFVIRFHHGHHIRYGGGVGGIFIPARKAVQQWDKARPADIDCFGHFHQFKVDFGNFICNGSLIGYAPYALSIKADYEKPNQVFFLVHHNRKEIMDIGPIWLD